MPQLGRIAALLSVAVALGACANRGDYAPPPSASTAMVRFVAKGGLATVNVIDLGACPAPKASRVGALNDSFGIAERSPLQMLGSAPEPRNDVMERRLAAGAPILIEFANFATPPCKTFVMFTPVESQQYEITFLPNMRCDIVVSRLEPGEGTAFNRVAERTARRMMPTDFYRDLCPRK
jgi:hypothetical protein